MVSRVTQSSLVPRDAELLTGILKMASEGVIVVNAELRILMFSPGAEHIFGYDADEVVGDSLEKLIPTRYRVAHSRHVAAFASGPRESLIMRERGEILAAAVMVTRSR